MSTVCVFTQHVNDEPALVLARSWFGRNTSFVVCLSAAYKYTEDGYLMQQAMNCAKALGFWPPTKGEVTKLADQILNGLDALVAMPPAPEKKEAPIGEAKATINGETFEFEI